MSKPTTEVKGRIRHTRSDVVFLTINWILLILCAIVLLYPLLYIIMSSFSAGPTYMRLSLIPTKFSLEGYTAVFEYADIWTGYRNSLLYTAVFTVVSLAMTVCLAYPLSRRDFGGGKYMMLLCVFTMYFSGGLIPTYVWMRQMKLLDSMRALIIPSAVSVYNMIVMRTYFSTQIPDELREASMLDGCSDIRYLVSIVLPLSGAILAVIGLYYAVYMWNEYFNAMVYITTRSKLPLPNFLREILMINVQHSLTNANMTQQEIERIARLEERAELMKYSLIIVSSVPVMILYPFVQKHFVKGVMIGATKG